MSAFGLDDSPAKSRTMDGYTAPYAPTMSFSGSLPYAFPVMSGAEPVGSRVYYYGSGYNPCCYAPYGGSDFSSSSNPDWYVSPQDWYSVNGVSYCPPVGADPHAAAPYESNGFYAYQSSPYPSQGHGDPFASSTIVTATPWEKCSPVASEAPASKGFQNVCSDQYDWGEGEDAQNQEVQEEGKSGGSSESPLAELEEEQQQTGGKSAEGGDGLNFKQKRSFQENPSTAVGTNQTTFESNVQGPFSRQLQRSGWHTSYSVDIPVSRNNISASRSICLASDSLEGCSASTLCGNFHKYEPLSTTEMAPVDVQYYTRPTQVARDINSGMEYLSNYQSVTEDNGKGNQESSEAYSRKLNYAILPQETSEQGYNVLVSDTKSFSWDASSHPYDLNNHVNQLVHMPPMIDIASNDLLSFQEMDSHSKRMEGFMTNCSKGGDKDLLVPKCDDLGSSPVQFAVVATDGGEFSPVVDILSSECHLPKPTLQTASSFSTSQSIEGSARHVDVGPSKLFHSSLKKGAPVMAASQILNESTNSESYERTKASFGTDASNGSSCGPKEVMNSVECHKLVHTMHNLSMLLLSGSSSDKLGESDFEVLQSVICNLSQCLLERMGVCPSTDGSALKPKKPLVTAINEITQKACSPVGMEDVPVEKTISADTVETQLVNNEAALNSMKLEIRLLRKELELLEMERQLKSYKGGFQIGKSETSVNKEKSCTEDKREISEKEDNCGCHTEGNLGMKANDLGHAVTTISQERSHGLPDLNLNPTMQKDLTDENMQQSNADLGSEEIEDQIKGLRKVRSCQIEASKPHARQLLMEYSVDPSSSKLNSQHELPLNIIDLVEMRQDGCENVIETNRISCAMETCDKEGILSKESNIKSSPGDLSSSMVTSIISGDALEISDYVHLLQSALCDALPATKSCKNEEKDDANFYVRLLQQSISCDACPARNSCMKEEKDKSEITIANHKEAQKLNPKDCHSFVDNRGQNGKFLLEDGAMNESARDSKSATCCDDLEDVDDMPTLEENSCSESDFGWEYVNNSEEDRFYSIDEDSVLSFSI